MKAHLQSQNTSRKTGKQFSSVPRSGKFYASAIALVFTLISGFANAQNNFTAVATPATHPNGGVMLLLSDGTVLTKTFSGGSSYGNLWDRLTPDSHGSYVNGTWTTIAAMHDTRLYFSSQVLKDGRVYVAGGEYGTGTSKGEVYDPLTNVWTSTPNAPTPIYDGNSEILDNGTVLQAYQGSQVITKLYDPATNTYATGGNVHGSYDESAWVKLPDGSILYVDINSTSTERYIPASNTWVVDATVPVSLYDPFGEECGAGFLLPDGRAFFIGSTGHTAYYTPSGTTSPGTWAAGPDIPNSQGTPDAAAAMMVDGNILCAVSPVPTSGNHFPPPTAFYEFDYLTNTFSKVKAPGGAANLSISSYLTNMLDLPDGTVLYGQQNSSQYYVYTPVGSPLAAGKPTITKIKSLGGGNYKAIGKLFNGISEGAAYGDDWQMATNYPIIRLTSGANVYYARTFNWNSTGVQRGTQKDNARFTLPAGIPAGTYSLVVTANGISSDPVSFVVSAPSDNRMQAPVAKTGTNQDMQLKVFPNPATDKTTVQFTVAQPSLVSVNVYDANGKIVKTVMNGNLEKGSYSFPVNTAGLSKGIYFVKMTSGTDTKNEKLIVQ